MKARFAVSCIRIQLDLSSFGNLFSNAARIKDMEVKSKFNSKTFSPLQLEVFPAGLQVCHSKRKWSLPHWCRRRRHHWFEPIRWFAVAEWWVASCLLQHTISVFCHGSRDAVLSPHPHSKFEGHPWGEKSRKTKVWDSWFYVIFIWIFLLWNKIWTLQIHSLQPHDAVWVARQANHPIQRFCKLQL